MKKLLQILKNNFMKQKFECYEIHRANMPQYGCNEQCKECLEKQSGKFINGEYPTNVLVAPQSIGKMMFQFDEDEPQLLTTLLEEAEFTIRITQSESSLIQFESKNGKKFKIFYEKI
jgi:hypothetical protein